jgi:alpha-L-rhamnosidase
MRQRAVLPASLRPKRTTRGRTVITVVLAVAVALLSPVPVTAAAASELSPIRVMDLRVNYLHDPRGIDDRTPALSWRLESRQRNQSQSAYQVRVASGADALAEGDADVWDSGRVASGESVNVAYGGPALSSRQQLYWTVRVWDERGRPSEWSRPGQWEMGLLDEQDWQADWVADPAWAAQGRVNPLVIPVPDHSARFVRLEVTRLGKPVKEGWEQPVSRLQLAEFQTFAGGELVSSDATARASEAYTSAGQWEVSAVTDEKLTSVGNPQGYTSMERFEQDLAEPIWLELDLGALRDINEIRLYPRTDARSVDGSIPNFPENFTVQTRATDGGDWRVVHTAEGQQPPGQPDKPEAMPLFARDFTVGNEIREARLYAVGLGVYEARLNGEKVGDAVLEPANTDYRERVRYTTYDVTEQLHRGENTLGFLLGNGIYNVPSTPGRYQKLAESMGQPKLLAQLELTYTDGSRQVVATDESWRSTTGPIVFSGWYGGEDYDARRLPDGWDAPGADRSGWSQVERVTGDEPTLSAQEAPPVTVQETLKAVSRTEVAPGVWRYDLPRNIAGWPRITVRGAAGQTVRMTTGERLDGERVTQAEIGGPVYFSYTPETDAVTTWHPRFTYHGFQYIEVSGVDEPPAVEDVAAMVLMADNERAGSLRTSDPMLNQVHELVVRATESNMYSVLTDCPHREKLGWLEETHLLFDTVAANWDVAAYYRQLVRNMADAQLGNGMVPDIAPEYTVFSGGFRDDPNWGGAIIMAPWKMYDDYGDIDAMREYYPAMRRYMDYLATKAEGHILDHGLGDWGAFDTSTPIAIPATTAYYRFATGMSEIASALGKDTDARSYRELAAEIRTAFNARYFDEDSGSYGSGSQASNALPLAAGMVPAEHHDAVMDALLADIAKHGQHLTTGEIGLRALLDSLGDAGRADVVLQMAKNPTGPSYAHMVNSDATTLWEFWDGRGSRNHFMMGAIDDWMYRYLGGIRPSEPGFREFVVEPLTPDGLEEVEAEWPSPYGTISSHWRQAGDALSLNVEVPVNTTATVSVPTHDGARPVATPGARFLRMDGDRAVYQVGSGSWRFLTH